jgi:putative oxidoreductase
MMKDVGLLTLRLTAGGLLMGHGMQKLAGKFGGNGLAGTGQWMESIGLKPGQAWATVAGLSEASGALMALGFLEPLGEIGVLSAMAMATGKVHWGKPIWGTAGGAEQPVTYSAIALMLVLAGPGKLSLDALLGTRLPNALALLAVAGAAGGVAYGLMQQPPAQEEPTEAGPPADQEHEPQTETGSGAL